MEQIDNYCQEMLKNGVKCGIKTDMKKAKTHVEYLYKKYLELPAPKVTLVPSAEAAIKKLPKALRANAHNEIILINHWTWWVAYYFAGITFLKESSGDEELDKDLIDYEKITHDIHAILVCEDECFVIEYPKVVAFKDNDLDKFVLHREGGLAFEYKDGTGFAWLNGIEVPDYVAITPAKKLSAKKLLAETNTDVRREGFKRMGILNVVKQLKAKVLDKVRGKKKWEHYDLLEADFGDKKRRFLKMKNPSSGDFVVERVADTCNTVAEANAMRSRETTYIEPIAIT